MSRKEMCGVVGRSIAVRITDAQWKNIAAKGKTRLTDSLKEKIQAALNNYLISHSIEKNAPAVKDLKRRLEEILKSAKIMRAFLEEPLDPLTTVARSKMQEELWMLKDSSDDDKNIRNKYELYGEPIFFLELKKRIRESRRKDYPIVDFDRMSRDLLFLEISIHETVKKLTAEMALDRGGRQTADARNALLAKMKGIYAKAKGKKGCFKDFFNETISFLKKEDRPWTSWEGDSVEKQATRITKKITQNKYSRLKNKRKQK